MHGKNKKVSSEKKALLKNIVKGKKIGKSPTGGSLFKMDNGLGKKILNKSSGDIITGGNGSNLGKNGIF